MWAPESAYRRGMASPPPTPPKRLETGEVVKRPTRRFPWRLWLYAIVMTATTGAAGYFAWTWRTGKLVAEDGFEKCKAGDKTAEQTKRAEKCETELVDTSKKNKELEGQLGQLSKGLNATKDELTALRAQKAEADKRVAAIDAFSKKFSEMVTAKTLRVSARRGQLVLSLPAGVLFPSGSADLSEKGKFTVAQIAYVLKDFKGRRFLVVGHTDNQDFGHNKDQCALKDNWQLSTERALTVTRVMVTAGMDAKDLLPSGAGEFDPIASNASEGSRQQNRRIEIVMLPAVDELPPLPANIKEDVAPKP
jgi:chemotaxis protein MotB